jgi:hypothetical protein
VSGFSSFRASQDSKFGSLCMKQHILQNPSHIPITHTGSIPEKEAHRIALQSMLRVTLLVDITYELFGCPFEILWSI